MSEPRKWTDRELVTLIAIAMIVGGVILRVQGIGAPAYFTFDEKSFAPNAYNYLLSAADVNDHPPLGKLLMAVGFLLFGYSSLGWRFASLCLGLYNLLVAYWLGRATWGSARAGLFSAACLAADGFFIAYSRAGLLDGMLVCFVMWGFLAAVSARSGLGAISSALLLGCATSIKWSGVMAVVPAAAAIWFLGRAPRFWVLAFALVPLVHGAIWTAALSLTEQPSDVASLWALMVKLYREHLARGTENNELASAWYTWPLLYHPIVVKLSSVGTAQRYASSAGNVVFFAAATISVVAAPIVAVVQRFVPRWRPRIPEWIDRALLTRALVFSLGWFAMMFPWMVARGKFIFWYHYLPSYGFALPLVAGILATLEESRPRLVLTVFGLALLVAVYYAPVWGEFTISVGTANLRLIPHPWKP